MLPLVVMTVDADGTMTVTVDGTPFPPAPFAPPWVRGSFTTILDQLAARHRTPLRIHVREADGTTFTDIITPGKTRRPVPEPEPEPESESKPEPSQPASAELTVLHGEGFVPGEDVAIAIVIAHSDAAPDGTARGLIETAQLAASPTREVILLGRVSGTLTIGHPE